MDTLVVGVLFLFLSDPFQEKSAYQIGSSSPKDAGLPQKSPKTSSWSFTTMRMDRMEIPRWRKFWDAGIW